MEEYEANMVKAPERKAAAMGLQLAAISHPYNSE